MKWTLLALSLAFVSAASGPAGAVAIEVDHAPGTDFSRFRTFAWVEGLPVPDSAADRAGERVELALRRAIEEELRAKGLRRTPRERADLQVVYGVQVEQAETFRSYTGPVGGGPEIYGFETYARGRIVVEIVDPDGAETLWTGTARGAFGGQRNLERRVALVVRKLFKRFPPEP